MRIRWLIASAIPVLILLLACPLPLAGDEKDALRLTLRLRNKSNGNQWTIVEKKTALDPQEDRAHHL